ncbi:rubredoxin family protein [Trifolium repens]|nr:rubredoxin family protein [Trifolium repens]
MSAMVAGTSSSCSATFTTRSNHSIKNSHLTPSKTLTLPCQKTSLLGLSLHEAKRGVSGSFLSDNKNGSFSIARRRLEITAKTAGASKTIEAEVDKPLGLTLGQKSNGVVVITAVEGGGNAAKAGLKSGDQVLYTSSFFGDELWPADKLGFTKTAIQAKPDSVYFVVSRGAEVDVKRLPKRPAPPRFGRKLTETQKARATHICLDCGYIYFLPKSFDEQPDTYSCPQCQAPKKRFAEYDVNTGRAIGGGGLPPVGVIIGLVAGLGAVGALLVFGLQ